MPLPPIESPAPTFLRVFYHTAYSQHVQTLKAGVWTPGGDLGSVPRHSDGAPRDLMDMLTDFLTLEAVAWPDTMSFDQVFLYTKEDPDSPALLRAVKALAIDGVTASAAWAEAVQLTLNGKDTEGRPCKLCLLDVPTGNSYAKFYTVDIVPAYIDIWENFSLDTNGWVSEATNKPADLISQTVTLNEKLRRSYRLG